MKNKRIGIISTALIVTSQLLFVSHAIAQQRPPLINDSPDPKELYGRCGFALDPGLLSKVAHLHQVGENLHNVLAVLVLECTDFSGSGGTFKTDCPAGSPYAYCMQNLNDGGGNAFLMGVLELNDTTRPNAPYTGCPDGATPRSKDVNVKKAGQDLRLVSGIVTLSCEPADGEFDAYVIDCPIEQPHPYAYCVESRNDGLGNAVVLGVVATNSASDAYGLYGECTDDALRGYNAKMDFIREAGLNVEEVNSIALMFCGNAAAGGTFPLPPEVVDCPSSYLGQFDYCVRGLDSKGNAAEMGVITFKNI